MLPYSHSPTPKVDVTKRGLSDISPTKMLSYSDSPTSKVEDQSDQDVVILGLAEPQVDLKQWELTS